METMITRPPEPTTTAVTAAGSRDHDGAWLLPDPASPVLARLSRRPSLQAQLAAGAVCTTSVADDWFRRFREPAALWYVRVARFRRVCEACPARAACLELALRDREGMDLNRGDDDMVRAGLTTVELRELGTEHQRDLEEAVARDDEAVTQLRRPRTLTLDVDRMLPDIGAVPVDPARGRRLVCDLRQTLPSPAARAHESRAWTGEEVEQEEDTTGRDGTGYTGEPEPEARLHGLVRELVADGDRRAARVGRRARRTVAEMTSRLALSGSAR
ncbi:hypothetical protein ABT354_36045 [Streptomyces sp. NPDC000594]|uniref:hypothetical protein n=1 Tax=Streptomyces sp. NPDC000594 TaxID=3154261 RepID=UPI00332650B7